MASKINCLSAATLIALLTTIGFQLVALLTTGWLYFRVGCRNTALGVYVGLFQACTQGVCVVQNQATKSAIEDVANHFEGQTVQDKVAIALISTSAVLLAIAFVTHCVMLCRPKEGLARVAGNFCIFAAVLVFCGCATWTGFLIYAETADIWNTDTNIPFLIILNLLSCDFKIRLFKDYTSEKPFPLQYSFFVAWISFLFTLVCIGLSSSVKQRFAVSERSAPVTITNQINLQPTTNLNYGNGVQPSAPGQQITSPEQIFINAGYIMSQNPGTSQTNSQKLVNPNQLLVNKDGTPMYSGLTNGNAYE